MSYKACMALRSSATIGCTAPLCYIISTVERGGSKPFWQIGLEGSCSAWKLRSEDMLILGQIQQIRCHAACQQKRSWKAAPGSLDSGSGSGSKANGPTNQIYFRPHRNKSWKGSQEWFMQQEQQLRQRSALKFMTCPCHGLISTDWNGLLPMRGCCCTAIVQGLCLALILMSFILWK